MASDLTQDKTRTRQLRCPWLKRVGLWGFLFFLVKGILWLLVPGLLVYFGIST